MEKKVDLKEAYSKIKAPVIIATKNPKNGQYDLTPYGWVMPYDYDPVTKVVLSSDPQHQADVNIRQTGEFAVLIPAEPDGKLVTETGSVSGAAVDKFEKFKIQAHKAQTTDLLIPNEGISCVIECSLVKVQAEGSVDLIFGQSVAAYEL